MEFEDILVDVGEYGTYQRNLILIFLVPTATLLPWFTMSIFFMLSVPEHWCYVPEVVSSNLSIVEQRNFISPIKNPSCTMYDVNYTEFLDSGTFMVPNDSAVRPCNQGWSYDNTYYDVTASSLWNMVCDDDHYPSLVLTLKSIGSIIGTPIFGGLSDKIGRRIVFFITIVIAFSSGIASVLTTNFTAFVVLKTINDSVMPCVFQLPYIIILEVVSPEMRTRMSGTINCCWSVGFCILPLVAYLSRDWVNLGLISAAVTFFLFAYWPFLPESPRWLVSQERYDEALHIMVKIAKKNGIKHDPDALLMKLKELGEKIKKEKTEGLKNSPTDLMKYPQLRKRFLIVTFCWVADVTAYYGLQLNVPNLGGNEFLNFFLLSLVEIPGYMSSWVFMEHVGRRWCCVLGFGLTGLACMLPSVLPEDLPHVRVAASLLGKYFGSAAFMATYQQSSELYPTTMRSLGMGMSSTISAVITFGVPYVAYLSVYGKALPFVIIGIACMMAAVSATFLPETLNRNLPQTITDCEVFGLDQKFFSWNRKRRISCNESSIPDSKPTDGRPKELKSTNLKFGFKFRKGKRTQEESDSAVNITTTSQTKAAGADDQAADSHASVERHDHWTEVELKQM